VIRLSYDVQRYRRILSDTVQDGDTVLELGPHIGLSTDAYVEKAGKVVLVDKGRDCAGALGEYALEHDNVTFVAGDARGFNAVTLVLDHIRSCDVFAVDLGGGRFPDSVFKVWATWSGVFKPRDSIIRCRGLVEFLRRARADDDTIPCSFEDSGWLADYGRKTPHELRKQLEEFKHWVDLEKLK